MLEQLFDSVIQQLYANEGDNRWMQTRATRLSNYARKREFKATVSRSKNEYLVLWYQALELKSAFHVHLLKYNLMNMILRVAY